MSFRHVITYQICVAFFASAAPANAPGLLLNDPGRSSRPSPCPEYFQYERYFHSEKFNPGADGFVYPTKTSYRWRGVITVPSLLPNELKVRLLPFQPGKYDGLLQLANDDPDSLEKVISGEFKTVQYHLYFQPKTIMPQILDIQLNSKMLCSSPPAADRFFGAPITLENSLLQYFIQNMTTRDGKIDDKNQNKPSRDSFFFDSFDTECGKPTIRTSSHWETPGNLDRREWPWIVPIFKRTELGLEFECSATLVTTEHIITAAHCMQHNRSDLVAYVGRYNISNWGEQHSQPRELTEIHIHPDFNPRTVYSYGDLAVVKLSRRVHISPYVRPVCMWTGDEDLNSVVDSNAVVFGWGMDSSDRRLKSTPKRSVMPIVSQETCLRSKLDFVFLTSNKTLCAGIRNGTGPCSGDSGGGLFLPKRGEDGCVRWYLRGIVSMSVYDKRKHMCDLFAYTVFTDVAKYKDWILSFIT